MKKKLLWIIPLIVAVVASGTVVIVVKNGNNHGHTHEYTEQISDEYLKMPATCTQKAIYYYSCECGEKSSSMFEYGEPTSHDFSNEEPAEEHLKQAATCNAPAVYYKSCSVCGKNGLKTFEYGSAIDHSYGNWISNGNGTHTKTCANDIAHVVTESCQGGRATCMQKAICEICGEEYGSFGGHDFSKQAADEKYLATEATCTKKAQYYYSCECGEKGTDTFEYGELAAHSFTKQSVEEKYLKSVATCTQKAIYYYSCECGERGTDMFEFGELAEHDFCLTSLNVKYLASEATCTTKAKYYYSCACGEKGTETFEYGAVLEHEYTNYVSDNNATCTQDGTKTATCNHGCGTKDTIINTDSKLPHIYTERVATNEYLASAATCTQQAIYYYSCACGKKITAKTFKYGKLANHTEVIDKAVAPTRTENGLTEGKHCSVCNKVLVKQNVVYATGSLGLLYENNAVVGIGTCTDSDIIIPKYSPTGNYITAIGDNAFANSVATSIAIPGTVMQIGTRAFYNCTELTEIHIPASVTKIGTQIFYKASKLTTVYYDSSYSDEDNIFLNIANIKKVVFGGRVIPSFILKDCTNITEVEILNSVTSIDIYAFYGCSGLTSVYYTGTIDQWVQIKFAWFFSNPVYYAKDLYVNNQLVTTANITSATKINAYAFYGCTSLISITIGNSVTSIGNYAFDGCTSLTSVTIPDRATLSSLHPKNNCSTL